MSSEPRTFHVGPDDRPDKYRLLHEVGDGGEAKLWKAEVAVAGTPVPVAVKILRPELVGEADTWRDRWTEQVEVLRLVPGHPAVVGVHDAFEGARMHPPSRTQPGDRALYLIMNWVEGMDLREWVVQHDRPEDRVKAQRYLRQVASVLDWLHSGQALNGRPVVHGDISPANVVIDRQDQAVLVDFSLVRVARHVTTHARGTRGYCAPEIRSNGEYTPASDRYAFGGLAYFIFTGTHPPEDRQQLRASLAAMTCAGDQPSSVDQLARIFADDPDARPSAGEWLRMLRLPTSTAPPHSAPTPAMAPAMSQFAGGRAGVRRRTAGLDESARVVTTARHRGWRPAWIAATTSAAVVIALFLAVGATAGWFAAPSSPQGTGTEPSEEPQPWGAWLADEHPAKEDGVLLREVSTSFWQRGSRRLGAARYPHSLIAEMRTRDCANDPEDWKIIRFRLGPDRRFRATAGLTENAPSYAVARFVVVLDGFAIESHDLGRDEHVALNISVADATTLELRVEDVSKAVIGRCKDWYDAVWGDARVIREIPRQP